MAVLPYSRKFLQVQNFVELPLRAPEGIFTVLIFAAPARTGSQDIVIFVEADLSAKNAKFCNTRKFPAIQYVHASSPK